MLGRICLCGCKVLINLNGDGGIVSMRDVSASTGIVYTLLASVRQPVVWHRFFLQAAGQRLTRA